MLEYGLGLRPDLTGPRPRARVLPRRARVRARALPAGAVRLDVAAFNERAIEVYERAGFRGTGRHVRTFARWGDVEFVEHGRAAVIEVSPEVRERGRVVALETTLVAHGFPPGEGVAVGLESERRVRDGRRRARRRSACSTGASASA